MQCRATSTLREPVECRQSESFEWPNYVLRRQFKIPPAALPKRRTKFKHEGGQTLKTINDILLNRQESTFRIIEENTLFFESPDRRERGTKTK